MISRCVCPLCGTDCTPFITEWDFDFTEESIFKDAVVGCSCGATISFTETYHRCFNEAESEVEEYPEEI